MTSGLPSAAEVAERVLELSTSAHCSVIINDLSEAEVRFANNKTTTNGVRRDRTVTVVAFEDRNDSVSVGTASLSGEPDLSLLVAAAEADARAAPAAPDRAPFLSSGASAQGDFAAPAEETSLAVFADVLAELPGAFARARAQSIQLAGFAEHRVSTTYLATSAGVRRRHSQPEGDLHLIARDGVRSVWAGAGTARFDDVTLDSLEHKVARRLEWATRQIELPAGRYETVLPPDCVADLMIVLTEDCSGRSTGEGRTVFSRPGGGNRIGEKLCDLPFTLRSDPQMAGLESADFVVAPSSGPDVSVFDNGLDMSGVNWVDQGTLANLRYHRAGAAELGGNVTYGTDNIELALSGATGGTDELVAAMDRGLLLTCLWYIREVDPATMLVTGLTRDGVFLVEKGEVVGAVNNFRFNESPLDVLRRTTAVGATERALGREFGEWLNRTAMPALRVHDFNMSTVSPAN